MSSSVSSLTILLLPVNRSVFGGYRSRINAQEDSTEAGRSELAERAGLHQQKRARESEAKGGMGPSERPSVRLYFNVYASGRVDE